MSDSDDTELLEILLSQVELITNEDTFHDLYGFSLEEYLSNRKHFTAICRDHADHIEQFVKGSGIAKTIGGSVTIVSGGIAILGIILAPFTEAASLGLTIGGVATGIMGASTTVTAGIVKDANIKSDKMKIEEAFERFNDQEKIISELLEGVCESLRQLAELKKKGPTHAGIALKGITGAGGLAVNGVRLANTVNDTVKFVHSTKLARFANNVSNFVDASGVTNIADCAAAPGISIFDKAVVVAGTTTAKVFSGVFAAFGIGFGIWDIVEGAKDINGSEIAKAYRDFADDYEENTDNLITGLEELSKLLYQDCLS